MPLDPQAAQWHARRLSEEVAPLYTQTLAEARAADLADILAGGGDPEPVAEIENRDLPGPDGPLPIRIYRPTGRGARPALVYFYGGGWTLGQIDTCDAICRTLTNTVSCVVIAAGYRLAPEHKFPAAVDDCFAAVRWVAEHADQLSLDRDRIAVGGDSAGGNLAAAVALLAKRDGPPLVAQLLVYPNTLYGSDTPSMRENDDPVMFNRHSVQWYWQHYLSSPADGRDPRASPLLAQDHSGLPPALVITAEYDPLRDEGELYAEQLKSAGVPVELTRYDGMMHGFFTMSGVLDGGKRAVAQAAEFLREQFGAPR